jgi:hypothetical protein
MALSTTQAELLATTDATKQLEWAQHLVHGIGITDDKIANPTTIYNDNNVAVILSKHDHNHKVTKHFGMRIGYIREKVNDGMVLIKKVGTKDNVADILTKPLTKETMGRHMDSMGLFDRDRDQGTRV